MSIIALRSVSGTDICSDCHEGKEDPLAAEFGKSSAFGLTVFLVGLGLTDTRIGTRTPFGSG